MSSPLSVLKAQVLANVGGDNTYFTDTDIAYFLNEAQNKLSEATEFFHAVMVQWTVSGCYEYYKPPDCIRVEWVKYNDRILRKAEMQKINASYNHRYPPSIPVGHPHLWADYNGPTIWVYPTPNIQGTLETRCVAYAPALINDTDVSIFQSSADDAMVSYATDKLLKRDSEPVKAGPYFTAWQDAKMRLMLLAKNPPRYLESFDEDGGIDLGG